MAIVAVNNATEITMNIPQQQHQQEADTINQVYEYDDEQQK